MNKENNFYDDDDTDTIDDLNLKEYNSASSGSDSNNKHEENCVLSYVRFFFFKYNLFNLFLNTCNFCENREVMNLKKVEDIEIGIKSCIIHFINRHELMMVSESFIFSLFELN